MSAGIQFDSNIRRIVELSIKEFISLPKKHKDWCKYQDADFDGEHLCSRNEFFTAVLLLVFDKNNSIVITSVESSCYAIVSDNFEKILHITPGGFFLKCPEFSGVSKHPLSRLIFWVLLTRSRVECKDLFTDSYLLQLNSDMKRNNFINDSCDSLQSLVNEYSLRVCSNCHLKKYGEFFKDFNVLGFEFGGYDDGSRWCDGDGLCKCNFFDYALEVLILSVLRGNWKGCSWEGEITVEYCNQSLTGSLDDGQNLSFGNVSSFGGRTRHVFREIISLIVE